MTEGLRRRTIRALALLALLAAPSVAQAQATASTPKNVTDYDRRATRCLFNTLRPGSVPTLADLKPDDLKSLNKWQRDEQKGESVYSLYFGDKTADADRRGYYKVSVGGPLSDAEGKGWTRLAADPKNGAEVFTRRNETGQPPYLEVGSRKAFGPVILTVSVRRPLGDDVAKVRLEVLDRLGKLIEQGRDNQLFGRLVLLLLGEGAEQVIDPAQPLPVDVSRLDQPVRLQMRLLLADAQNKMITGMAKRFAVEPTGPLAQWARIEGQGIQESPTRKRRYYLSDSDMMTFTLVVEPATGAFKDAIVGQFRNPGPGGAKSGGLKLKLGLKYR